jgi:hypothetical protein
MPLRLQSSKAHPDRARYEKIECCDAKFGAMLSDTLRPAVHDIFIAAAARLISFGRVPI